jgi:hypothetical protein
VAVEPQRLRVRRMGQALVDGTGAAVEGGGEVGGAGAEEEDAD